MKDTNVPVERKCEYCGCPESTAVNAGVKCNMTPGKPLHSFQEKSVPVEKWEKEFDEKFGDNLSLDGPFDKSYAKLVLAPALKDFISQTIQAAKEEERERIVDEVSGMFSVYPDGGIHDFGPDEELVSKKSALSIINKHQ